MFTLYPTPEGGTMILHANNHDYRVGFIAGSPIVTLTVRHSGQPVPTVAAYLSPQDAMRLAGGMVDMAAASMGDENLPDFREALHKLGQRVTEAASVIL